MKHQSKGNDVVEGGIVHRCSCGWTSRPCFSNMLATLEGRKHRDREEKRKRGGDDEERDDM